MQTTAEPKGQTIRRFRQHDPLEAQLAALQDDGAIVIDRLIDGPVVDAVLDELQPDFDRIGRQFENDFNGYAPRRLASVLAYSMRAAELIEHSHLLKIADAILLPHCLSYRIGSSTGIQILSGEEAQVLHQDDEIYPMRISGVIWQLNVMIALNDFTNANGATRVVIGSHREDYVLGKKGSAQQAEMDRGSALVYLGATWHGGGANRTHAARTGIITTYSLGWLRQEVNQYLTVPRERAEKFSRTIQNLLGYRGHGQYLGRFPEDPDGFWLRKHQQTDTQK